MYYCHELIVFCKNVTEIIYLRWKKFLAIIHILWYFNASESIQDMWKSLLLHYRFNLC
jgi:hypothetical protein